MFASRILAASFHFLLPVVAFDEKSCRVDYGLSRAGFFHITHHAYVVAYIRKALMCVQLFI